MNYFKVLKSILLVPTVGGQKISEFTIFRTIGANIGESELDQSRYLANDIDIKKIEHQFNKERDEFFKNQRPNWQGRARDRVKRFHKWLGPMGCLIFYIFICLVILSSIGCGVFLKDKYGHTPPSIAKDGSTNLKTTINSSNIPVVNSS